MSCAASPQPPPRAAAAAALAPGFRFHPTDEELVIYYLKRKVTGRSFRVDAISEIDLYKAEPWDLPLLSRIKSRDTEWYFFSALDKKYANRSRTNRATVSGYWKTTGKDRAVCSGGRVVGMKKTLVFHIGRAPKGDRSEWVMHEYRLEDGELARAGIPQDAFVVCRIFQKRGPGPQNGAQYGAPFVEEEWEEDELPILKKEDDGDAFNVLGNSMPARIDDYEQIQDMGVQDENSALLVEPGLQDDLSDFFVPDSLLKICEDEVFSNGKDGNIEMPGQQSDQNLKGICIDGDAADQNQHLAALNDEFLELNDFACPMDAYSHEGVVCPEMHNDTNFSNGEISSQQELLNNVKDFSQTNNENNELSELLPPSPDFQNNYIVDLDDLLGPESGHYASDEADGNGMPYFDGPSNYRDADHGLSADMNNFMDSTIASSSEPDLDEWIAYFDATENMQSSALDVKCRIDTSNQSNLALVNGHNVQEYQTPPQAADMDGGTSSLPVAPNADISGESDAQYDNNSWDKAFTKRLVSMLGAISSPPAFAAEYPPQQAKSIEQHSAAHSSSSMHVAAGMIQIHGETMSGTGKNWSMQKNRDAGVLLSYGPSSDETGNLAGYVAMPKIPGGIMAFVRRNSFHLLFLSVLFLASSFKIWVYIYGR